MTLSDKLSLISFDRIVLFALTKIVRRHPGEREYRFSYNKRGEMYIVPYINLVRGGMTERKPMRITPTGKIYGGNKNLRREIDRELTEMQNYKAANLSALLSLCNM